MKIGIISNGEHFIPMAYTLAGKGLQVCICYAPSEDPAVQQKVLGFIQATRIPFQQEQNPGEDVYQWLETTAPDIIFVYGYRFLLDVKRFNGIPAFNIHPGPLPSFRGPVPVFWQLKTGQPVLGLTIHVLSERFDAGKSVWSKSIPNMHYYNYGTVNQLCSQLCMEGVITIINAVQLGIPYPETTINNAPAAYHKRPQLQDVLINWEAMQATEVCNLIRACNPWNKGALTIFNGQELRLIDGMPATTETDLLPGTISYRDDNMYIACAGGSAIRANTLFLYEGFMPAYYADMYGLRQGVKLGQ